MENTPAPPQIDVSHIVHTLIEGQAAFDRWLRVLNSCPLITVDSPVSAWPLLDLALDILGQPPDNAEENDTGEREEVVYCRDTLVDIYYIMVVDHEDIDGFLDVVAGRRELPDSWNDASLAAYLYPPE